MHCSWREFTNCLFEGCEDEDGQTEIYEINFEEFQLAMRSNKRKFCDGTLVTCCVEELKTAEETQEDTY